MDKNHIDLIQTISKLKEDNLFHVFLIPNQTSYSLGKLVRSLGIPVTDRHRASGDAIATVKLFKMILANTVAT